jgi:hypothetical protein
MLHVSFLTIHPGLLPFTYSPIHPLFFFLPFLVAVLQDQIPAWYDTAGLEQIEELCEGAPGGVI